MNFADFQWWTAERVSAAANAGVFFLAVITAVIALVAVFQTKKIIRQNEEARTQHSKDALGSQKQQEEYNRLAAESANHQAKSVELQRESVERTNRPMMTVRYLPPKSAMDGLELEVSNVGKSVAYQVRVEFDPALPEPDLDALNENSDPGHTFYHPNIGLPWTVFVGRMFRTWVPGQKVTAPFWVAHKDYEVGDREAVSAEGIPANQLVHIYYKDEKDERYADTFELDPGIWAGTMFHETFEQKQRKAVEKLSKAVEGYGKTFTNQVQAFLNRATSPTQEEIEKEQKQKAAIDRIRARQQQRKIQTPPNKKQD